MKKTIQNWAKYMALGLLFAVPCMVSCSDDDANNENTGGGGTITMPSATVTSVPVAATAGVRTLTINFGGEWSVALDKTLDWLDVSPRKGAAGVQNLTLTLQDNKFFDNQSTDLTFTIGGETSTIKIVQDPAVRSIRVYEDAIVLTEDTTEVFLQRVITNLQDIEVKAKPSWIETVELTPVVEGAFTAKITLQAGNFDTENRDSVIVFKDKATDYTANIPVRVRSPKDGYAIISCPDEVIGYNPDMDGTLGNIVVTASVEPGRDVVVCCYDYNENRETFSYVSHYVKDNGVITEPMTKAAYSQMSWSIPVKTWYADEPDEFLYDSRKGESPAKEVKFGVFIVDADQVDVFEPGDEGHEYHMVTIKPFDKANFLMEDKEGEGLPRRISVDYNQAETTTLTFKAACPIEVKVGNPGDTPASATESGIVDVDYFTAKQISAVKEENSIYTLYTYEVTSRKWENVGPYDGFREATFYVLEKENTANGEIYVVEEGEDGAVAVTLETVYCSQDGIKEGDKLPIYMNNEEISESQVTVDVPTSGNTYAVKVKAMKGFNFDVKLGTFKMLDSDGDKTQSGITEDGVFTLNKTQEADEGTYEVYTYTVTVPAGSDPVERTLYIIKKTKDDTYTLDAVYSDDEDVWDPIGYKPGGMTEIVFSRK